MAAIRTVADETARSGQTSLRAHCVGMCCGLNGSTQHFALDTVEGVYGEESKEPSTFQESGEVELLEASGIAELG